jgi:hypothetical protein
LVGWVRGFANEKISHTMSSNKYLKENTVSDINSKSGKTKYRSRTQSIKNVFNYRIITMKIFLIVEL